jgi:hypothetical protein
MPLMSYFHGLQYDPETARVMGVAYEMICASLQLDDQDPMDETVAKKIIEITHVGVRDLDQLCELALTDLRGTVSS